MHITWQGLIVQPKRRQAKDETMKHHCLIYADYGKDLVPSAKCYILNRYIYIYMYVFYVILNIILLC